MSMKKHTDIPNKVRIQVHDRDSWDGQTCCINCGKPYQIEEAHFIPRSRGGIAIPENLGCLCQACHKKMDQGDEQIRLKLKKYLMKLYPYWSEDMLKYDKWS